MSEAAPPHAVPPQAVRRVAVVNKTGLHARPASMIVQRARGFEGDVALVLVSAPPGSGAEPGMRVDAKNVLDVMFLAAPQGAELDVEATGPEAARLVDELARLFASGFA